jgi:hypothetical protein
VKKLLKDLRRQLGAIKPTQFIEPKVEMQPGEEFIGILPENLKAIATLKVRNGLSLADECAQLHASAMMSASFVLGLPDFIGHRNAQPSMEEDARHMNNHGRQRLIEILLLQGISEAFPVPTMMAQLQDLKIEIRKGWKIVAVEPYPGVEQSRAIEVEIITIGSSFGTRGN